MEKKTVNIKKLDAKAVLPTYGSEYSAGADLYACLDEELVLQPGETKMIHTGIAMEVPVGYAGSVLSMALEPSTAITVGNLWSHCITIPLSRRLSLRASVSHRW